MYTDEVSVSILGLLFALFVPIVLALLILSIIHHPPRDEDDPWG